MVAPGGSLTDSYERRPSMQVRPASLSDAEAIRSIFNHEVLTSTSVFELVPRTLAEQQAWLGARTGAHAAVVAVEEEPPGVGEVQGFGSLSPFRDRSAYRTTVENSVFVRNDRQGLGVGRLILTELLRIATASGFHCVMARVTGGNEASVALHRSLGFRMVGTEKEVGRKFNRWLDVVELQRLL